MPAEPLSLDHQELLYKPLRAISEPLSEYSFANLYLFRQAHGYEVLRDRHIFIKGRTYDGTSYLMPTVPLGQMDPAYLQDMLSRADCLFPIPEAWLVHLPADKFVHSSRDGDSDYLLAVERMSSYPGRALHKKRNLLSQFERLYPHGVFPLTPDRTADALEVLDDWQKNLPTPPEQTDYHPCREALQLAERLILCGIIYYVEKEPAGFVLGDELNNETFALHFAKAKTKFKGVYEYVYNAFANILPPRYKYMNFEQDLDQPALRAAKSAYQPHAMLKKFRVSPA